MIKYLDMGVDAIRIDTAKHIERDELLTYVNTWNEHKPNLFVFGEVLVKGLGYGTWTVVTMGRPASGRGGILAPAMIRAHR